VASSWLLFSSYHNDARSNKHQIKMVTLETYRLRWRCYSLGIFTFCV